MNHKAFFDTNVLVYVVGQRDDRTAAAEHWRAAVSLASGLNGWLR